MEPMLLAGTANTDLADVMARTLGLRLGAAVLRHPDGEIRVELRDDALGRDAIVLQSLADPAGERLLEMLLLADAARRAGARRLFGIVPYLAYARQERRTNALTPIGARVVADALSSAFDRVVALDLHAPAVEGFFSVPLDHLTAAPAIATVLLDGLPRDAVVVSPDLGAAKLAEHYARMLGLPFAVIHKTRTSGEEVAAHGVMGAVEGRHAVVVDDMISTGGTVVEAVRVLLAAGCRPEITVAATHLLLAGSARERLAALPLARVVGTDSLPVTGNGSLRLKVTPVGPLLAEAARRLHEGRTLDGLVAAR